MSYDVIKILRPLKFNGFSKITQKQLELGQKFKYIFCSPT